MKTGPSTKKSRSDEEKKSHKEWKRKKREEEKDEDTAEFQEALKELHESKRRSCI